MLRLSDEIAERAGVRENLLGFEMPCTSLPEDVAGHLAKFRGLIQFREEDLRRLGIPNDSLSEFIFDPSGRSELTLQKVGHTDLERRPLAMHGSSLHVLLPTAIASAISRFVIEAALAMRVGKTFEQNLCGEFAELFDQTPILGGRTGAPLQFQRIPGGQISGVMTKIDPGRLLYLIFFVDGLAGYLEGGLSGANADPKALGWAVSEHLNQASTESSKQADFVSGICLLVGCGLGRSIALELETRLPDRWRFEMVSAYDLVTLSWLPGIDELYLWRLLDSLDAIRLQGAELLNVNGLLNLAAWCEHLDGHLVPHGRLPDGFIHRGKEALIEIPQNSLRELRQKVLIEWNPRRVLDPDGNWLKVRKISGSEFDEERAAPLYGCEDDIRNRKLRGVYVAPNRPWWIGITAPAGTSADAEFTHWMMLCTWLRRTAPKLDEAYPRLPRGPIFFDVAFEELSGITWGRAKPKSADELRSIIQISAESNQPKIRINVAKGFDDGLIQPENIAERVLVEALVAGAAVVGGEFDDATKREALANKICPNPQARFMHRFQVRSFRDFVSSEMEGHPELISPLDDAALRIGLGWKVRSRDNGAEISGTNECTSYLNDLVQCILDDVCAELKCIGRRSLVRAVLYNHEIATRDRDIWSRSSQANIAMHEDKSAALRTIVRHQGQLNACFAASRILLEAGICECPFEGGRDLGRLDLSRLMCKVLAAHQYGGWSDAIYWRAMEPSLRITPLGDVHMKPAYINEVYEPFGRAGAESTIKEAIDNYATLYEAENDRPSFESVIEPEFLTAWADEYGASLESVRSFVDQVERRGQDPPKVILELSRSALVDIFTSATSVSPAVASETIETMLSKPRPEWRNVGSGFASKDWYPWRFRRRLSILRRPLLQIDAGDDPIVFVAPGLLRESFAALVSWFHRGEIPDRQARSNLMGKWIGHANDVQRRKFNTTVADRMRELGWRAESEVKLTKILGRPLDRNYGDIDVLAWRPETGRVLLIECKDLQYLKTLGEVAEQLADFRGEIRPDGKPDHLRRHLDRLDVLAEHKPAVSKALGLASSIQLEGHLVFKNPVPMQFAWDQKAKRVGLSLFAELNRL
jgi:hypothetical protein